MIPSIPRRFLKIVSVPMFGLAALAAGCGQVTGPTGTMAPAVSASAGGASESQVWVAPSNLGSPAAASVPVVAASESQVREVAIDNFSFNPPTVTVPAGTTISWVKHDDVPHTVTANDHSFSSKGLDTDVRFSRVFTAPGTYAYFCAVHPHMTGQVIVK